MQYVLTHMNTMGGVGCFAAQPGPNLSFSEVVAHLEASSLDDFMHAHFVAGLANHRPRNLEKLIKGLSDKTPALRSALYEACLTHDRLRHLLPLFGTPDLQELSRHTPSILLRSEMLPDKRAHAAWNDLFWENIRRHQPLPAPDKAGFAPLYAREDLSPCLAKRPGLPEARAALEALGLPAPVPRPPVEQTIARAMEVLDAAGVFLAGEMRHKASLSPIALLRNWVVETTVRSGRMRYGLEGIQTSYGRGLVMENARASLLMEVAERVSSYASVGSAGVLKCARPYPLVRGSFEAVSAKAPALDPNDIRLEVPYQGQELSWMEGDSPSGPVLVPVQCVFLFCNLDEQSLFSGLGSTGLASGNTMEEARLSGLCEVLERDADATTPLDLSRCFRLETDDPEVARLLSDYAAQDTHVWFQDVTGELGLPVFRAFVTGRQGDVNQGMGAGLDARRALLSAMTETPYPFPGPASAPAPEGLPVRRLEDFPNLSAGGAAADLALLEGVLTEHGYRPIYVDLTRKDLGIPVCRAMAPGLEIVSDLDDLSRVSPRLYLNYLKMFE